MRDRRGSVLDPKCHSACCLNTLVAERPAATPARQAALVEGRSSKPLPIPSGARNRGLSPVYPSEVQHDPHSVLDLGKRFLRQPATATRQTPGRDGAELVGYHVALLGDAAFGGRDGDTDRVELESMLRGHRNDDDHLRWSSV